MKDWGKRLVRFRGNVTQAHVVNQTSITKQHLIAIEKGRVSPKLKDLELILEAVGSDLPTFCGRSIPKTLAESQYADIYLLLEEYLDTASKKESEALEILIARLCGRPGGKR